jgi:hypothetical protein
MVFEDPSEHGRMPPFGYETPRRPAAPPPPPVRMPEPEYIPVPQHIMGAGWDNPYYWQQRLQSRIPTVERQTPDFWRGGRLWSDAYLPYLPRRRYYDPRYWGGEWGELYPELYRAPRQMPQYPIDLSDPRRRRWYT